MCNEKIFLISKDKKMIDAMVNAIRSLFSFKIDGKRIIDSDSKDKELEEKEEILSVEDIYTPLSVAKEEIWKRWNDEELKARAKKFLGNEFPLVFNDQPNAVIFRFIATPNFEFKRFFDLSNLIGLKPVYAEFLEDKFCTRNQDKLCLGQLIFSDGENRQKKNVIEIQSNENKKFSTIKTLHGKSIIDLHHKMLHSCYGNIQKFDVSKFKTKGESPKEVYVKFFTLFLCNGVLFENYISKEMGYEKKFSESVILPAIREVINRFGVKPIIVPLLPIEEEDHRYWMWYSKEFEDNIKSFCE